MNDSPWGTVQNRKDYLGGFVAAISAVEGDGLWINKSYAELYLSRAALNAATFKDSFGYWYNEQRSWIAPIYELPSLWADLLKKQPNPEAYLLMQLSLWNPGYLIERSIIPILEPFECFVKNHSPGFFRVYVPPGTKVIHSESLRLGTVLHITYPPAWDNTAAFPGKEAKLQDTTAHVFNLIRTNQFEFKQPVLWNSDDVTFEESSKLKPIT